mmetsp:Transcript_22166/g.51169  ORF Transcript_22166/g.51169 Transcript_22166/m.51169 type:complete len:219 (+) Transcript_22166:383-1039(+)
MGHESVDVLVVKLRFTVMQTLVRLRTLGSTAHHLAYPLFQCPKVWVLILVIHPTNAPGPNFVIKPPFQLTSYHGALEMGLGSRFESLAFLLRHKIVDVKNERILTDDHGAQLIERIPCWRCQHRVRLGDDQWVGHGPDRSLEGVRLHQVVGIRPVAPHNINPVVVRLTRLPRGEGLGGSFLGGRASRLSPFAHVHEHVEHERERARCASREVSQPLPL